ncbi:glycerol-3-phosphate acyltransferase [Paenibacillus silviterrae]|uniref:glycerol-3-phosphate acyltransferase n=1 Tax=Paenibacillus silviterrae TaxID=3242194 RepID=UPI0025430641|nr:glycerol-3-phosphate acyltransferase [Paenibacillus chinjuensis]
MMLAPYWWQLALLVVCSYLVGNFCAAIFISARFAHRDIRELGSKNPGTTNMTRVFGLKFGAATLLIDFLKGLLCVLTGKIVFTSIGGSEVGMLAAYAAGLAVILGHNYPLLLRFRGGKGFATGIGVFLVVNPLFTLLLLFAGVILLLLVDRMSVFALTFFTIEALYYLLIYGNDRATLFACGYLGLAVIAHWPNILRLAQGEEKPLGLMKLIKVSK